MVVIIVISQHAIKMTVIMFKILDMIKHLSLNGSLIFTSLFLCICLLVSVWQWQAVDLIFTNLLPLLAHPAPIRCPLHRPPNPFGADVQLTAATCTRGESAAAAELKSQLKWQAHFKAGNP